MSNTLLMPESNNAHEDGSGRFTGVVLRETYTLGRCIGRGGMGEVYEASHGRLPGRMAVKILLPELRTNEDAFRRFCREPEIMSALQHPHIIQIFDFNTAGPDGLPYFVMEYLDGIDLRARLARSGPMSVAATLRVVGAVASALDVAHAAGVVHRDLKPANIFLMRGERENDDFVKVIDFGISKAMRSDLQLTSVSDIIGTPDFMSPEQALGRVDKIDARTDQFALAAITYAMLTNRAPFVGEDAASVLYQVVHEPHPPLARFRSGDATKLQAVLDRALSKRQEDRYDSVLDFARALEAAATTKHPAQSVDSPPPVRSSRSVDAPPPVRLVRAQVREEAARFDEIELPRSIDRVPHGPLRGLVLALVPVAFVAFAVHNGWQHRIAERVVKTKEPVVSFARAKQPASRPAGPVPDPTAIPVVTAPRLKQAHPPAGAVSPAAMGRAHAAEKEGAVRRAHGRHPSVEQSGWQSIQIVSQAPQSREDNVAASAEPIPPAPPQADSSDGFSIPEPTPTPAAADLAPPPVSFE
ncbi:MAG: protein kinase [Acidobacteria bacterium]|nr:protein kinase [Acidobacteriota bacterium]